MNQAQLHQLYISINQNWCIGNVKKMKKKNVFSVEKSGLFISGC